MFITFGSSLASGGTYAVKCRAAGSPDAVEMWGDITSFAPLYKSPEQKASMGIPEEAMYSAQIQEAYCEVKGEKHEAWFTNCGSLAFFAAPDEMESPPTSCGAAEAYIQERLAPPSLNLVSLHLLFPPSMFEW